MIDEVTRSLLDSVPTAERYELAVVHSPDANIKALTITIDDRTYLPGIGYESVEQFEFDREQIASYLLTRKQSCGGCGSCRCG